MRTSKVINRFLSVLIAMAMIFVIPATTLRVNAADLTYNVKTDFKGGIGDYLYKYVLEEKTSTITQSQLDAIEELILDSEEDNISYTSFSNMQRFTNLKTFEVTDSTATSLDLSKNTKLERLYLNKCTKLTSISVYKQTLKSYYLEYSPITSLDISDFPNLEYFGTKNNSSLTKISINNCPKLDQLVSYNNFALQSISGTNSFANVSTCELYNNSNLVFVPLTSMPNLKYLNFHSNPLSAFDISKCTKLRYLEVNAEIGTLNLSNNPALLHAVYDEDGLVGVVGRYEVYMVGSGEYKDVRLMVLPGTKITPSYVCGVSNYHFKDPAILSYVRDNVDTNGDGFLSATEVNTTTVINLKNAGVKDASGLKLFKNISVLNLSGNSITSFDMTPYTKMGNLDLSNNPLTTFTNTTSNSKLYLLKLNGCKLSDFSTSTLPEMAKAVKGTLDESNSAYNHYYSDVSSYGLFIDRSTNIDGKQQANYTPTPEPTPVTGVEGFCERLYTCALGRTSDPNGVQSWVDAIKGGADGAKAARGFFFSDEFINKKLDNKEYVTRLYKTFMDREPDAAGLNAWVEALEKGASREKVFDGFVNSQEWANICFKYGIKSGGTATPSIRLEPSAEILAFAERLYTTCLGRSADPSGLKAWADALANREGSGAKVARGFFFSDEFINKKYDNGEFVRRCYLTFMDREPDADGYAAWVKALNEGASREKVFDGFTQSPEFVAICEKAGIIPFG